MKGRKLLPSTKQKISNALKGWKHPNFGKRLSAQQKEKISKSLKKYWENKKKNIL